MTKLSLDLSEIGVTSFVTDSYEEVRGTVLGNDGVTTTRPPHCGGTVIAGRMDDDCTSGCVCCRFRPARAPQD